MQTKTRPRAKKRGLKNREARHAEREREFIQKSPKDLRSIDSENEKKISSIHSEF